MCINLTNRWPRHIYGEAASNRGPHNSIRVGGTDVKVPAQCDATAKVTQRIFSSAMSSRIPLVIVNFFANDFADPSDAIVLELDQNHIPGPNPIEAIPCHSPILRSRFAFHRIATARVPAN